MKKSYFSRNFWANVEVLVFVVPSYLFYFFIKIIWHLSLPVALVAIIIGVEKGQLTGKVLLNPSESLIIFLLALIIFYLGRWIKEILPVCLRN